MADETVRHAWVKETGESTFAVDINVADFTFKGDEPSSSGGKNLGPAPYDMLLAALGECTAMTVRWYAKEQNWPLDKVEVQLTHHKETREGQKGRTDVFDKRVTLHGAGLTQEHRSKLLEVAGKCPVQRTMEGNPEINTILSEDSTGPSLQ